jgi:hypothetical protein
MADNISFPVHAAAPRIIATDEADYYGNGQSNAALGKIIDGVAGGVTPLAVTDHRALLADRAVHGILGTTPIGETAYADKAVIGGAFELGSIGAGLYQVHDLVVIMGDVATPGYATDPIPNIAIGLVAIPDSVPLDSIIVDGYDASTFPVDYIRRLRILEGDGLASLWLRPDAGKTAVTNDMFIVAAGDTGIAYGQPCKLWAVVIADGAIITDLTSWSFIVSCVMSYVGDSSRN